MKHVTQAPNIIFITINEQLIEYTYLVYFELYLNISMFLLIIIIIKQRNNIQRRNVQSVKEGDQAL